MDRLQSAATYGCLRVLVVVMIGFVPFVMLGFLPSCIGSCNDCFRLMRRTLFMYITHELVGLCTCAWSSQGVILSDHCVPWPMCVMARAKIVVRYAQAWQCAWPGHGVRSRRVMAKAKTVV